MTDKSSSDSGVYLFALELGPGRSVNVGSLGSVRFKKGWYVYVGSAKRGLSRRLARHMNNSRGKVLRWHIDFLRNAACAVRVFPIPTRLDLECRLARDVAAIAAEMVPRFGCRTAPARPTSFGSRSIRLTTHGLSSFFAATGTESQ